ncbi:hypothetical protein [Streptomyces olivaceoviridis]|uniref:hypothetical protein n=1 Tax=Streptomyces olivaceoviridis TaxID=1921 RepID=UPI0036F4FF65
MPETTAWPFGTDAIQDDPLTALRIPVVTSFKPMWHYTGAFLGTNEDTGQTWEPPWPFASAERPAEREVQQLLSFIAYHRHYWQTVHGYDMTRLDARPLDVDCNSATVFIKYGPDDWGYGKSSWTYGPTFVPGPPSQRGTEYEYATAPGPLCLDQVMDLVHTIVDEPMEHWTRWKAEHPDVFPPRRDA